MLGGHGLHAPIVAVRERERERRGYRERERGESNRS